MFEETLHKCALNFRILAQPCKIHSQKNFLLTEVPIFSIADLHISSFPPEPE